MKRLKLINNVSGIFYLQKRLLKFKQREDVISYEDIMHMFVSVIRMLKETTERTVEKKYIKRILILENEVETLKKIKNVNL